MHTIDGTDRELDGTTSRAPVGLRWLLADALKCGQFDNLGFCDGIPLDRSNSRAISAAKAPVHLRHATFRAWATVIAVQWKLLDESLVHATRWLRCKSRPTTAILSLPSQRARVRQLAFAGQFNGCERASKLPECLIGFYAAFDALLMQTI